MDSDDKEADENEVVLSTFGSHLNLSVGSDKSRKHFFNRRRLGHGVLGELAPISETNTFSDYSLSSKGRSHSFIEDSLRKGIKEHSHSFSFPSSNLSSSFFSNDSSFLQVSQSEHQKANEDTPPKVLRQRLGDAKDIQEQLQKELDELRDFTTAERQILSVEKGFDSLQDQYSHLKMECETVKLKNSNLTGELEQMNKFNSSQKSLIDDLKESLDNAKTELKESKAEKEILRRELEEVKIKLAEEECRDQLAETKWKRREEELKRSLDEAWTSLKVKEDRLTKLKEKIRSLYSERESIMSLSNALPQSIIEKVKTLGSTVADLFNYSVCEIENDGPSDVFICKSKFEPSSNKDVIDRLNIDIVGFQEVIENQKNDLNNLAERLRQKESEFKLFCDRLHNFSHSFEYHNDMSLNPMQNELNCADLHEDVIDKITCEFAKLRHCLSFQPVVQKFAEAAEARKQNAHLLQSDSDSGVNLASESEEFGLKKTEVAHVGTNIESLLTKENIGLDNPSDNSIKNSEIVDGSMQCSFELADISCQTQIDFISLTDHESKISRLQCIIKEQEDVISQNSRPSKSNEIDDASTQTILKMISFDEHEQIIDDLKINLNEKNKAITRSSLPVNMHEIYCQTQSGANQINLVPQKPIHLDVSCQTSISYISIDEHELKINEFENKFLDRDSDDKSNPAGKHEDVSCQTEACDLKTLEVEINPETTYSPDSLEEEFSKCHEKFTANKSIQCIQLINEHEERSSQTEFKRTSPSSEFDLNESSSTVCEMDSLNDDHPTTPDKRLEECSVNMSESNETDYDSCINTYGSSSTSGEDSKINISLQEDVTLSEFLLEPVAEMNFNKFNQTSFGQNAVVGEFINLPATEASVLEFTFNSSLEHSILRSKLRASDTSVLEATAYDPLATESESTKPIIEIPFMHSLAVMGESKVLANKCRELNNKLQAETAIRQKSLTLLDEFVQFLCPNVSEQYDVIAWSEIILSDLKEVLNSHNESMNCANAGLIASFRNLKSTFGKLGIVAKGIQSLKDEQKSLKLHLHSLGDINSGLINIEALLSDFHESFEVDKNRFSSENEILKGEIFQLRSDLKSKSFQYTDLHKSYQKVQVELQESNTCFNEYKQNYENEKIKLTKFMNKNDELKNKILKCEADFFEQSKKVENLLEQVEMLGSLQSVNDKYSILLESYSNLESELSRAKEKYTKLCETQESLLSKIVENDAEKQKLNLIISEHVEKISEHEEKITKLEKENESLIYSIKQDEVNADEKLAETIKINELECQLSECRIHNQELCTNNESLLSNINQLEVDQAKLKDKMLNLEKEAEESREKLLEAEKKHSKLLSSYQDLENNFLEYRNSCEKQLNQIDSLKIENDFLKSNVSTLAQKTMDYDLLSQSYNTVKQDQMKYFALVENLQHLTEFIKNNGEIIDDSVWDNMNYSCEEVFRSIKDILSELPAMREKVSELNESLNEFREKNVYLVKKVDSLSNDIEISIQEKKLLSEELNNLIKKEKETSMSLKEVIEKYNNELEEILNMLEYSGKRVANEESWEFIKQQLSLYRGKFEGSGEMTDLEKKVTYLESELLDVDNFKRKFSREIHELEPNLKVHDLMKEPFEFLLQTLLKTIMEKEIALMSDLSKDYEGKLALTNEKVNQLEEEVKRHVIWIQEIENENERLQGECNKINNDNEKLKADLKSKSQEIISLEKRIKEQKASIDDSLNYDAFSEKHEFDQQEKEKSFIEINLQDKVSDLNKKLEAKNHECYEAFNSLQLKSEAIFQLEKVINDLKKDKSNLQEEVKHLKEELSNQANSCIDNKGRVEVSIEENSYECERIAGGISPEALVKGVQELGDYVDELQKKNSVIDCLGKEIRKLEEMNEILKNENKLHDFYLQEQLHKENSILKKEVDELKAQISVVQEEGEALIQATSDSHEALKDQISALNECLRVVQNELESYKKDNEELLAIKDSHLLMKEELKLLNEKYLQSQKELRNIREENITLNAEMKENNLLKDDYAKLTFSFEACQAELKSLKESPESADASSEALSSLNEKLNKCRREVERLELEKESLRKELLANLDFEKSLLNSTRSELALKENEVLNLLKEKDLLTQEILTRKKTENLQIANLENKLEQIKTEKDHLCSELHLCQKSVHEKNAEILKLQLQLDEVCVNYHSKDNCPFREELLEKNKKIEENDKLHAQECKMFELWRTNLEDDIRCKAQLILDLESKLKKEAQIHKEGIILTNDLHQKLIESEEKIKKLEDKIMIQREVFMKEKSKLEQDAKAKEICELKLFDFKNEAEELANNIKSFLEKTSNFFSKNIPDLDTALNEIRNIQCSLEEEKENVKQLDEECEILNKQIGHLENDVGKYYVSECDLQKELTEEKSKVIVLLEEKEKLTNDLKESEEKLGVITRKYEEIACQYLKEKKAYELNIENLLETKRHLKDVNSSLEHKLSCLLSANEQQQKQENSIIDELRKQINLLKLEVVHKNTKISNLEMRLECDGIPFQKRAEAAEKKVEELIKELKSLKYNLAARDTVSVYTSPISLKVCQESRRRDEEYVQTISNLEDEVRRLQRVKSSLKKIAVLRHKELKELRARLGLSVSESSLQDSKH